MTDQEKLKKLFQAALQDSSEVDKPLTRAFPAPATQVSDLVVAVPANVFVTPAAVDPDLLVPMDNAGLDGEASKELAVMLDDQRIRISRKQHRATLVTCAILMVVLGGGGGWFASSPQRVQAGRDAIREVRSVGDISSVVASYRSSLDKVAARGEQIEHATGAMGVTGSALHEKDPYLETEMTEMMGGEGRTVGERNAKLNAAFGDTIGKSPINAKPQEIMAKSDENAEPGSSSDKTKTTESFDWQH